MIIQKSIPSAIQTMGNNMVYWVIGMLLCLSQNITGQIDTNYYNVVKSGQLSIVIDTSGGTTNVDTITSCDLGSNFGMYMLEWDTIQYTASTVYGRDTLCTQVEFENNDIDTSVYVITVLPSSDTIAGEVAQNSVLNYVNGPLEILEVDSFALCNELVFGSIVGASAFGFDYHSGFTSGLEDGCLVVYGDYGITDTLFFPIQVTALDTPTIDIGEWFIDTDPGIGNGNTFTIGSQGASELDLNIPLSEVSNGLHTLFVRVKDDNGFWSFKQHHLFFKQQGGGINDVSQMEYYIDVDPGYGNGNFLPSSNDQEVDVTFNVDIDDLPAGLHTLFIRAKNEQNYWSFSAAHTFFKVFGVSDSPEVVSLEYYLDDDPGLGNGVSVNIPQGDSIDYVVSVDLNGLSTGIHTVYFRGMASNGFWSHVQSHTFFVVQGSSLDKQISQLEYFYNIDPGYGNAIDIPITPSDSIDITASLSLSGLPVGNHDLYLRAKDDNELWSIIYQESVEVTESDLAYPEIAFEPAGLTITAEDCFNAVTSEFYIKNTGQNPLTFNIDDQTSWLSFSDEVGSIEPDDSLLITVLADPQGLTNAQLLVDVDIMSNDAISPDTTYSIVFNVPQGAFSAVFSSDSLLFLETQIDGSDMQLLTITNTSCQDVQIDSIILSNEVFESEIVDTLVAEGTSVDLPFMFLPIIAENYQDTAFIYSDAGIDTITLLAESVGLPLISLSTDTLVQEYMDCPMTANLQFYAHNQGEGPLYFQVGDADILPNWISFILESDTILMGDSSLVDVVLTDPPLVNGTYSYQLDITSNDTLNPLVILTLEIGVAGDAILAASVGTIEPDTIPRNTESITIIDLKNIGCESMLITEVYFTTNIFSSNVNSVFLPGNYDYPVHITFSPPYAGTFIDTMTVVSDVGVLKVPALATASGAFTQEIQPLAFNQTIQACDGMTMDTLIVKNVGDGEGTWEITNSNTSPDWLYIATLSDTLGQGDSSIVEIGFDATGLINANYETFIQFQFSDPITPSIFVPVDMYVEGAALVNTSQDTLNFGYTYYTTYKTESVTFHNTGCDTLHMQSVNKPATFMVSDSIFDVLPNDSFDVVVTYDPNEINVHDGSIEFYADTDTLSITLLAEGVEIPKVTTLNKDSLVITMPKDVDVNSLSDSTWVVWGDQTGTRTGTYNIINGNEMVFLPNTKFIAGEMIHLTLIDIKSNSKVLSNYKIIDYCPVYNLTNGVFKIIPTDKYITGSINSILSNDLNEDGKLDLIFNFAGANLDFKFLLQDSFFVNNSVQEFSFGSTTYASSIFGFFDLDGSGSNEIVLREYPQGASVFKFQEGIGFTQTLNFDVGQNGSHYSLIDLDSDADFDLIYFQNQILGGSSAKINILKYENGLFGQQQISNIFSSINNSAISDHDRDGLLDITGIGYKPASTQTSYWVTFFTNNISSLNRVDKQVSSSSKIYSKYGKDLINDGLDDLIFKENNQIQLLPGESIKENNYNNLQPISDVNSSIETKDINGDGHFDIFHRDQTSSYSKGFGNNNFEFIPGFYLGGVYSKLIDLDNDGDLDIAYLDEEGRLWLAINEDSNAEMALSQDSIIQQYYTCNLDTTYTVEIYNNGDSTFIWQVNQPNTLPSWMTIDTAYGQVAGGDSLAFNLGVNINGLTAGAYNYDLVFNNNDTTSYHDTLHVGFEIVSDSLVSISEEFIDFGYIDTTGVAMYDLVIVNDGCEEITIDSMFAVGGQYYLSAMPLTIPAFSNESVTVFLDANSFTSYIDTLTLTYNYGAFTIPLSAIGCSDSPITVNYEVVCDIDSVGIDSLLFTNESGCDSLVITKSYIGEIPEENNLIAYFTFNGNSNDQSGNGNNGTVNGPVLTSDRLGNENAAYYFDGQNDRITVDNQNLNNQNFTIAAWVKWEEGAICCSGGGIFNVTSSDNNSDRYALRATDDEIIQHINYPAANNQFSGVVDLADNQFHFIVATYDGVERKLYSDGLLLSTGAFSNSISFSSSDVAYIGVDFPGGDDYFKGVIDDILIYNIAIDSSDIVTLFNDYSQTEIQYYSDCDAINVGIDTSFFANQYGCDSTILEITSLQNPISPEGLVTYYPFDGNAEDMSGYENDGVVNGASLTTDRFGNVDGAYSFDGVDDYIRKTEMSQINFSSGEEMSVSFWINPKRLGGQYQDIIANRNGVQDYNWMIYQHTDGGEISLHGVHQYKSSFIPDINEWTHITFTVSSNQTSRLFANGILVDSILNYNFKNSYPGVLSIGNYPNAEHFEGSLDDIIISSRVLLLNEIQSLYQEGASKYSTSVTSCDISAIGSDTTILINQYGCDSTIIEITALQIPISTDGLIAHYPFDGNAEDMSGFENDGSSSNPIYQQDRFGNPGASYFCNGSNNDIRISNPFPDPIYDSNPLSISIWVKPNNNNSDEVIMSYSTSCYNNGSDDDYFTLIYNATQQILKFSNGNSTVNLPNLVLADGYFHHVGISFGSEIDIYVDGLIAISETLNVDQNIIPDTYDLVLGKNHINNCGGNNRYTGGLDDVLIFSRILDSTEIQQLYLQYKAPNTTIATQDTLLDFGTVDIGDTTYLQSFVTNATCDTLYPIFILDTIGFQIINAGDTIFPYQSMEVELAFTTDSIAMHYDTLMAMADGDTLLIPLTAMSIGNADIELSKLSYSDTLTTCDAVVIDSFYIFNIGTDPLNFEIISSNTAITTVPTEGMVAVDDTLWVINTISASGLNNGWYLDSLTITSDDAIDPEVIYNISILVDGQALKSVSTAWLDFGNLVAGDVLTLNFEILNGGCDSILISSISNAYPEFTYSISEFNIPPFDSRSVDVTYAPTSQMMIMDSLILSTDYGNDTIILMASACEPSASQYLITDVCEEASITSDTSFLTNQFGCDSLIINNSLLPTVVDDSESEIVLLFNENATDNSPNGYNASLTGATFDTDRLGNANSAISCDGFFDYAVANGSSELAIDTSNFALSIWFKTSSNGLQNIISKSKIGTQNYLSLSMESGQLKLELADPIQTQNVTTSTSSLADDTWHHVLAVRSSSGLDIYIDGILVSTQGFASLVDLDALGDIHLGILQNWTDGTLSLSFDGSLDNFRLFNNVPNQQNIDRLVAEGQDYINTTTLFEQVCDMDSVGVDTTFLTNQFGCDSLVYTYYQLPGIEYCIDIPGYTLIGDFANHCYYASQGVGDWMSSRSNVYQVLTEFNLTGNLLVINSEPEGDFFINKLPDTHYYLGMRDHNGSGDVSPCESFTSSNKKTNCWVLDDNTSIILNNYEKWYGSEPNNYNGNEDFGILFGWNSTTINQGISGFWNDGTGIDNFRHILEVSGQEQLEKEVQYSSCELFQIGTDTTALTNQYGCDSTIIEITSLQTPISPEGLVAYYPFDGNAEDMSGYEHDGVVNGATLTEDRFGNVDGAYSFDGVDDEIRIENVFHEGFKIDNPLSFSGWIKTSNAGTAVIASVFSGCVYNDVDLFNLQILNSDKLYYYQGPSTAFEYTNSGLSNDQWRYIATTFDGDTLEVYIDGIEVGKKLLNPNSLEFTSSLDLVIGGLSQVQCSVDQNFNGDIDDVMLFSKALTPSEIQQLYLQSKAPNTTIGTQDSQLDFGTITNGDTTMLSTFVTNATCDTIEVNDITTSQSVFWTMEDSLVLLPYQSAEVEVFFSPTASVPYAGLLSVYSIGNDTISIDLKGGGCDLCACPTEDVVLHNQAEVDNYITVFGGCDTIDVNFTIDETSSITDISELSFLSQANGNVVIKNTTTISDLGGLANLQDVIGSFTIKDNSGLTSLAGLERLKMSGPTTITQNEILNTISGLDSLTIISGNLKITNNPTLTDCAPVCYIINGNVVTGTISISGNPAECSTLNEVQIRCTEGCPVGDYMLISQAEVDAFAETFAACDSVIGNLTIDGDDITDLSGLSFIEVITGKLTLKNNLTLLAVNGLQNLTTIGNHFIFENNAVTEIDSLIGLVSVMGNMTLKNNAALQNVNGLTSLDTINGNLIITNNTSLSDCSGICALISPSGTGGSVAGSITISGNPSECSSLTEVTIRCSEGSCPDFDVTLRNQIEVNAYVATFSDCDSIFGSLTIQGGNSIQDINGLSFIQYVGGSLIFKNNYDLDSISGLDSVQYVGGDFKIENNHELQDISQLMMLTHIGGELRIYNNDMLTNLTGLDSIGYIGDDLKVQHNALLSDCSVLCLLLEPSVIQGNSLVNNNPNPCSNLDQVEAICTYGSLISQITIENLQDTIVEGDSLIFDIVVDYPPSDTLIINLSSNNTNEVPLPLEVTILPDSVRTTVAISLPDDGIPEQNDVVTITAGAQYLNSASDQFLLTNDDDIPGITLIISQDTISEAAGLYATTAKVVRQGTGTEILNITLSSNSNELYLPSGINILANETEKSFYIGVYDNAQVEGLREALVTASYIIPSCICPAPASSEGVKAQTLFIADNDGPTLELTVNPLSMEEGKVNAGTLIIKRNTDVTDSLVVNISVSDQTEISLPATITIPQGQSQIGIPIETLNDPLEDGNQEVTISVNASGFTGGDVWVIVTDINKPDLIISEVSVEEDSIDSEVLFPFNVKIHNKGLSSSTQGVNLIGYASKNNTIDANDHIVGTYFLDISVASGDTIDYPGLGTSPEAPGGYKLIFKVNPNQSITELLYLNNTSSPIDITIRPEYFGSVNVADSIFLIGEEIVFTGSSYNNQGIKRPNTPLEIFIYQGQVRRNIQITTDLNGNYTYTHYPLMSEYGHFEVGVGYPGLNETDIQDEYDVLGVKVNNGNYIIWNMDVGDTLSSGLTIRNVTEVDMDNVTLHPLNLPNGCQLVFDTLSVLPGNAVNSIGYEIVAGSVTPSGVYQQFPIEVYTGATKLQTKTGYYVVNALNGSLKTSLASINTTINQNTPKLIEFTITNVGQGGTGPINISLPNNDWIRMVSMSGIPSLANGQSATVLVEFVPTENLPLNTPASGNIAINAGNANGIGIPFTIQKVSDEKGGITVDVIDQFTYFTDEAPHVDSARVRISHYFTGEVFADALTGVDGTVTFDSLPEGQLRIVVDAYKHKSYDGVIDISAGASFTEVVFLEYQAISFSWDVISTEIEDEYEIELIMNFESNAPVPVVVISVPREMPDLEEGETFAFNVVLTNQGLITAQGVQLDLPDDPEYEFITNYEPQDILAQQVIQVPVLMKLRAGSGMRNSGDVIEEANRRLNIKN